MNGGTVFNLIAALRSEGLIDEQAHEELMQLWLQASTSQEYDQLFDKTVKASSKRGLAGDEDTPS